MAAYMVAEMNMRNTDWRDEYVPKTGAILQKHGGKVIGRGVPPSRLEGEKSLADAMVIIEFPSTEAAKAFYGDPDYAPLIKLRQSGADSDLILIDGV